VAVGRRERKKLETKERLLDCAVALFAERGYDATTMDDIGECGDVARATVFNYFARKEDIVAEVFGRRRAEIAKLIAEAEVSSSSTTDRLRHALLGWARLYEADPPTGRAMVRAWLRAGGPLLPDASESAHLFADLVRAGQKAGDLRTDLDADAAGLLILDTYLGVLFRWVSDEDGQAGFEESLNTALDLVLSGLAPG
jgi:AcrR family transcriptional regulator